jgi:hypothetical protein
MLEQSSRLAEFLFRLIEISNVIPKNAAFVLSAIQRLRILGILRAHLVHILL